MSHRRVAMQMQCVIRTTFGLAIVISVASALALGVQGNPTAQMAELNSLKEKVKDPDTRTRVAAFHRVWMIALDSNASEVKILALDLMSEPAASASDHIRMPALYAIAEVANSSSDAAVKSKALADLKESIVAGQLPIRLTAIDVVNTIMGSPSAGPVALQAIQLLGEPVRSGNNGVRLPAINAVTHIALASNQANVVDAAIDLLQAPLNSAAMIGGVEVRMMTVAEVEKLGVASPDAAIKAKAIATLEACAGNSLWEPEARARATEGVARIQGTMQPAAAASPAAANPTAILSVSSVPSGADIEVDGSFVGNTPSHISVTQGDHVVRVSKAGFKPWERKLKASSGSTARIDAELEAASQ